MLQIASNNEYKVVTELGPTQRGGVKYLVEASGKKYLLEVIKKSGKGELISQSLANESVLVARLSGFPGVPKIEEYISDSELGQEVLAYEMPIGHSLRELMEKKTQENANFSESEVLNVLGQLLALRFKFKKAGIIHGGICPENIFISPQGQLTLVGFDSAKDAILGFDCPNTVPEKTGLCRAYCSPELLGLLGGTVAYSSDLFSIGVIAHEMLTGRRPFESPTGDFSHLTYGIEIANPCQPGRGVRIEVGLLCLALLKRVPFEREEQADELLGRVFTDARNFGWNESGEIKFCGRQRELSELGRFWKLASSGTGKLLVLDSDRGFGKTRLARQYSLELIAEREKAGLQRPFVVWVSCREFEPDVRGSLIAGLQKFIEAAKSVDQRGVEEALASVGERDLLDWLLSGGSGGEQPFTLENHQEIFRKLCVQVIEALCQYSNGLCLIVDDAHFIDEGSEGILNELKMILGRLPMLLLLVFDRTDPMRQRKVMFSIRSHLDAQLSFCGFSLEDSREFVQSLMGNRQVPESIFNWLHTQSKGSPFLLRRLILSGLSTGNLLPSLKSWTCSKMDYDLVFGLKDSATDYFRKRVGALSPRSLSLLRMSAAMGNQVDLQVLSRIVESSARDLWIEFDSPSFAGLIAASSRNRGKQWERFTLFSEEDFREFVLAGIPSQELQVINQSLARALEEDEVKSPTSVLRLARYFALGEARGNEEKICKWNFQAGLNARKSFRYLEAIDYFATVGRFGDQIQDQRVYRAYLQIAELSIYLGKTSEARDWITKAERCRGLQEDSTTQAFVSYLKGYSYTTEYSMNLAEVDLAKALELLNVKVPEAKFRLVFEFFFNLVRGYFGYLYYSKLKLGLRSQVVWHDEASFRKRVLICNTFSIFFNCLMNSGKNLKAMWVTTYAFWNSGVLGNHPDRSMNLNICAIIFADLGLSRLSGYFLRVSQLVAEGSGRKDKIATARGTKALCSIFLGHSKVVFDHATEGLTWCEKYANMRELNIVKMGFSYLLSIYGRHEDSARFCLEQIELPQVASSLGICQVFIARAYSQLIILGRNDEAGELVHPRKEYVESLKTPSAYANDDAAQIIADCEMDQVTRDTELRIARLEKNAMAHHPSIQSGLIAIGYIRLEQFRRASKAKRGSLQPVLLKAISRSIRPKKLTQASHFLCHYWILRAGASVVNERYRLAQVYLWLAQRQVRKSASVWGEWALFMERARLARALGNEGEAKRQANEALEISNDLGWTTRSKAVERWLNSDSGSAPSEAVAA